MTAIRALRRGEGAALVELSRALADHHGLLHEFNATGDMFEREFFRPDAIAGALVAEEAGKLIGCAVWHRSFSTFRGCEVMYLEDLAVLAPHRGRGIGRTLMQAVARLAAERGYPSVAWLTMGWNEEGRRFYEGLGAEIETDISFCRLHGDALERLAK
jgi:GNAT superfamily N-acetyltransferase